MKQANVITYGEKWAVMERGVEKPVAFSEYEELAVEWAVTNYDKVYVHNRKGYVKKVIDGKL